MTILDISMSLDNRMVSWPNTVGYHKHWKRRMDQGDECNNSLIEMDIHAGTHIDAPIHFIDGSNSIDKVPIEVFIGPCRVINLLKIKQIYASHLDNAQVAPGTRRLLIRTDNSEKRLMQQEQFTPDFVSLSVDAAEWIVSHQVSLVGIDYLSIGAYGDGAATHQTILGAGTVALEGLNLVNVEPGDYELICLPLNLKGCEGSPVRAILRK
jgi:arylformamidase